MMKEMYAQLGISSEVYEFGHKIEESLKERFSHDNGKILDFMKKELTERGIL